jgi:amino acid transporter
MLQSRLLTAGYSVMIVGASISMLGYLSSNILSVPRSWYALGRDRFSFAGAAASKFHTPHIAIVLHGAIVVRMALSDTFALAIFTISLLSLLLCAIAVMLRPRVRGGVTPFIIPGGPIVPLLTCIVCAVMISTAGGTLTTWRCLVVGGGYFLFGERELRVIMLRRLMITAPEAGAATLARTFPIHRMSSIEPALTNDEICALNAKIRVTRTKARYGPPS